MKKELIARTNEQFELHKNKTINDFQSTHMKQRGGKNFNYMEEGTMILELMKNISNTYIEADLRKKSKLIKVLPQKCVLK